MLDAGCAALLEDEDKLGKQSILQRKSVQTAALLVEPRRALKPCSIHMKTMSRLYSTAEHQLRLAALHGSADTSVQEEQTERN